MTYDTMCICEVCERLCPNQADYTECLVCKNCQETCGEGR